MNLNFMHDLELRAFFDASPLRRFVAPICFTVTSSGSVFVQWLSSFDTARFTRSEDGHWLRLASVYLDQ